MKTLTFLTFTILSFIVINTQGQTLLNMLELRLLNIEMNGNLMDNENADGRMLLPFITTKIILYQNNELIYWAEFKYKQCGKKTKLTSKTYVELNDGKVINGNQNKIKGKIEEGQPAWLVGINRDTLEINSKKDLTFIAGFNYNMRYKN